MTHHPQAIATAGAPAAIGPYSQAVRAGELLFCSGQIALDPESGELVAPGDVLGQTRQVLDNLRAVLQAAGSDLPGVVRTSIYLTAMEDFPRVNEVYAEYFSGPVLPARATVAVKELPRRALVEIDAIAVL